MSINPPKVLKQMNGREQFIPNQYYFFHNRPTGLMDRGKEINVKAQFQ